MDATSIRERYDAVSPHYGNEHADKAMRLYWQTYEHLTLRGLESVLPADRRSISILDAGGGCGKYGVWLAKRGHRVTVLDISPGMLEQAQKRFIESGAQAAGFVVGDLLALPFQDESFDLVLCEGDPVSYCLDRYTDAIRELVRVARRGAPVILGVDNRYAHFVTRLLGKAPEAALSTLRTGLSSCPYGLPVRAFTLDELESAVAASGAELVEIFGKPVLFFEILQGLGAERGKSFDPEAAREEIFALQEKLAHGRLAVLGGHFQVMARRP